MAQDQQTITCPNDIWTLLTNANVTEVTFEVLSGQVYIRFTTNTTTPTEAHGIVYQRGQGELQKSLSALTKLASAARVWAKPVGHGGANSDQAAVYVDHA